MKYLKRYRELNEGLRDKMTPKPNEHVIDQLGKLPIKDKLEIINTYNLGEEYYPPVEDILDFLLLNDIFYQTEFISNNNMRYIFDNRENVEKYLEKLNPLDQAILFETFGILGRKYYNLYPSMEKIAKSRDITAKKLNHLLLKYVLNDKYELIKLVLNMGADINKRYGEDKHLGGYTVLMLAIENEDMDVIEILLERGADLTIKDNQGKTALDYTSKYNDDELLSLLKKYSNIDEGLHHKMVGKSEEDIIKNIKYLSPIELLNKSVQNGFLDGVKIAFEKEYFGIDDINYSLENAAYRGHLDIVKFLVEKGGNVNHDNGWPLRQASINSHLDVVKYLVEKGADVNNREGSALKMASYNGNLDIVKYLIKKGAKVKPEFILESIYNLDVVKYLVKTLKEKGEFDNDEVQKYLKKALRASKSYKHEDVVEYLKSVMTTNESLRDKMIPKSADDFVKGLDNLNENELKQKLLDIWKEYIYSNNLEHHFGNYEFSEMIMGETGKNIFQGYDEAEYDELDKSVFLFNTDLTRGELISIIKGFINNITYF